MAISWKDVMYPIFFLWETPMALAEMMIFEGAMRSVLASPVGHHNRHNRRRR